MNTTKTPKIITEEDYQLASRDFFPTELGQIKAVVENLPYSKNASERTESLRLIRSFLTTHRKIAGLPRVSNIEVTCVNFMYHVADDDAFYSIYYRFLPIVTTPVKPVKEVVAKKEMVKRETATDNDFLPVVEG